MSDPFIATIMPFGFNFAPVGWMPCSGQLLPIQQYTALFSLIGTYYGGDGVRTFALPNLSGNVPIGYGSAPGLSQYEIGETGGAAQVTLTSQEMAIHSHALNATTTNGTTNTPGPAAIFANDFIPGGFGASDTTGNVYNPGAPNTTLSPHSIGVAGNSLPHDNMQPFISLMYCIAVSGIFPARG